MVGERWSSVVHAQSPRHVERCAELGRRPSDGESAFPRSRFLDGVQRTRNKNDRRDVPIRTLKYHEAVCGAFVRSILGTKTVRRSLSLALQGWETNMKIAKILLATAIVIISSGALAQQGLTGSITKVDEA